MIIQSVPDEAVRPKQLSCSIICFVTLPSMEVDAPSLCKKLVAIALIALVVGNQRNPSRISLVDKRSITGNILC